jgi:type II secretory pathway component PulJ
VRDLERGLTLVEVTIVMVLASLVMVGLVGFYISAQTTWLAASSQAVSQREGTLALEAIADSTRRSVSAVVSAGPDPQHDQLTLTDGLGNLTVFAWHSDDSLLYWQYAGGPEKKLINSRVRRFVLSTDDTMVTVVSLEVIDPNGVRIPLSGGARMYNRP